MYVVVPTCWFCEKVQDNDGTGAADGAWVPLKTYRLKYGLQPDEIWGSHTDCPDCAMSYDKYRAHSTSMDTPTLSS
jgi:hypothetical protein